MCTSIQRFVEIGRNKYWRNDNIKFYEVSAAYVNYLAPHEPHPFRNKKWKDDHRISGSI